MNNPVFKSPILSTIIGAIISAIATALTTRVLSGEVNYQLVGSVFFVAVVIIIIISYFYQIYFSFPFIKWRVEKVYKDKNGQDKRIATGNSIYEGVHIDNAWEFKAKANGLHIYGPYIYLPKAIYTATFRVKVDHLAGNRNIIDIDVVSRCQWLGDKTLAKRILTTRDFILGSDAYHNFFLPFRVFKEEPDVEMRIHSFDSGHTITVDYIKLARNTDTLLEWFIRPA